MTVSRPQPHTLPLADLLDLGGRTAIVTGGAKGIGLGIARRLHEAGANVAIADLDGDGAADAAAGLEGDRSIGLSTDVSREASVERMIADTADRFGAIDILVNNAGIFPVVACLEIDPATFRHVVEVNLVGVFLCTQAVARRMVEQGRGGTIVNITSIDALHPSMAGLAHYDASKHGVWGFTKNVALELAEHRIRVNALAPGGILTPGIGDVPAETLEAFEAVIPMHRMGDPDDIARATLFLASELSSYMTGAQVVVDGGRLLA
jgi:2-dehydro-3-deoxy-D-gluconate 5-dehydrogenase